MTRPGQNRVQAPRPSPNASTTATKHRPHHRVTPSSPSSSSSSSSAPSAPAVPRLPHHPFSKNLRWTAVTLVRALTSANPPERPCAHVADTVARAALRDIRTRFPNKDLLAVERNARRRVYDAVKVMAAVGAIRKARKKLKWLGVHHLVADASELARVVAAKRTVVADKRVHLHNVSQSVSQFRTFLSKRRAASRSRRASASARHHRTQPCDRLYFPFVLVNAHTAPHLSFSSDRTRLSARFDASFSLFSETDIISMLLDTATSSSPETEHGAPSKPNRSTAVTSRVPTTEPTRSLPSTNSTPFVRYAGANIGPSRHSAPAPRQRLIMMRLRDHVQVLPELPRRSRARSTAPSSPIRGSFFRSRASVRRVQSATARRRRSPLQPACTDTGSARPPPSRRSLVAVDALPLKLRVRAPEPLPSSDVQSAVANEQRKVPAKLLYKLWAKMPREKSCDDDEVDPAEDERSPGEDYNTPNIAARAVDDEPRAVTPEATEERHRSPRNPVDRQAIWGQVVDQMAARGSASKAHRAADLVRTRFVHFRSGASLGTRAATDYGAEALEEMERELVEFADGMEASNRQHRGYEQQQGAEDEADLLCYEEPNFLAEAACTERVRNMAPPPPFVPPRLEPLDPTPDLEEQEEETAGPDAAPVEDHLEDDDDLLDMDMDSEPCLSEGEP